MALTSENFQRRIAHFQKLRENNRRGMLNSIEAQFIHMAQGGDGTAAMEGEIRKTYYPTWADKDFKSACQIMGWKWEQDIS